MSRYTLQAYQELMRDRQTQDDPEKLRQKLLKEFYEQINQQKVEDTPIGVQNLKDLDASVKQATTPVSTLSPKKSLGDLKKDSEFATRADRFLDGIGSNENIFEYLRDADYSLGSAIVRSFETGKWTDEQKEDYVYLRDQFNNAELRGFKENFGMVKDVAGDVLLDPLNIVTALFAIPSGGATVAGRAAIGEAARQGVKRLTKAKLQDAITKETAKSYGIYGAAEGLGWGGLHNYFMQDTDINLGLGEDIDYGQVLAMAGVGGLFGGGVGAGLGAASGKYHSKFVDKEYKFVNEDGIDYVGPSAREEELAKFEMDAVFNSGLDEQTEDIFFNIDPKFVETNQDGVPINPETGKPYLDVDKKLSQYKLELSEKNKGRLNATLAKTFGKPTTEFLELVDKSPTLENFLRKLRYDYDEGVFKEGRAKKNQAVLANGPEGTSEFTYGEYLGSLFGRFHYGLGKAFNNLYRVGYRSKLLEEQNEQLKFLLRDENLGRKFVNKGDDAVKDLIGKEYRGIIIDEDVALAYTGVKKLLNDIYDEASDLELFRAGTLNKFGYFPRMFNYSALEKDFGLGETSKFKQLLINSGHADPTNETQMFKAKDAEGKELKGPDGKPLLVSKYNDEGTDVNSFGRNFALEASGGRTDKVEDLLNVELQKAKELKSDAIIQDMLEYRYTPFELRQKGAGDSNGYMQPRRFTNISDDDLDEFLEGDVQDILEQYTTNIAQTMARKKYFGANIREFEEKEVSKIIDELGGGVEGNKVGDKIRTIFKQVTGIEQYKDTLIGRSNVAKAASDWGKLSQQMAHLPLATLSSISEPLILLSRVGTHEVGETVGNIGTALKKEGANIIDRSIKGIKRIGTAKIKTIEEAKAAGIQKGFKDLDDWQWEELYQTGLALEQSVQERIAGLAGEALHGSTFAGVFSVKEAQSAFFKVNLLTQWTKAVQLASFTTGKMMIRNRIRDLYNHSTGAKVIKDKKRIEYYEGQLQELGIDKATAMQWYKNSLNPDGRMNSARAKGLFEPKNDTEAELQLFQQRFYKRNVLGGANRFTKEVILNPSVAEANRPLWFSSPSGSLLTQFAGYPTVFSNTVLKRFVRETRTYPLQAGLPKVLPTVMLMTGVGVIGNLIRSQGKSLQDYETGQDLPAGRVILDGVRRWGGYGPFDYVNRISESNARKDGLIASGLKGISGPIGQDVMESVQYRQGLTELLAKNLPGYGAYDLIFGEGTRAELRKRARQIDKGRLLPEDETPDINLFATGPRRGRKRKDDFKPLFSKGGIVKNVSNVTDEPDEMKSRVTKRPFNSTAEFVQDEEDRALKAQMESLGLREPYVVGGLAKALTKTIKGKQRSSKRLRKDYLNPDYLETLKPKSAKAASESKFNKSAKDVYDLLMDGQITVKEAETYLKDYGYQNETVKKIVRSFKEVGYGLGDDFISYREPFVFGGLSMLGRKNLMKLMTEQINNPKHLKNPPSEPTAVKVKDKIKKEEDLTYDEAKLIEEDDSYIITGEEGEMFARINSSELPEKLISEYDNIAKKREGYKKPDIGYYQKSYADSFKKINPDIKRAVEYMPPEQFVMMKRNIERLEKYSEFELKQRQQAREDYWEMQRALMDARNLEDKTGLEDSINLLETKSKEIRDFLKTKFNENPQGISELDYKGLGIYDEYNPDFIKYNEIEIIGKLK